MREARWLVAACVCVSGLAATAPKEDRRQVGALSFSLPAAWKYETPPAGADHVRLTFADAKRYCIVSLYDARAAGADLAADLATEWTALAGSIGEQEPSTSTRTLRGRNVIEASGAFTGTDGSAAFERIAVLGNGAQIATMIVITSNATTQRACVAASDAILASIKFPASQTTPAGKATPATPGPATTTGSQEGKQRASVAFADFAGTWGSGAHLMTYTSDGSGRTTGSQASFAGAVYTIRANGTYGYTESGMNGSYRFHNTETGKVSLVGDELHFTSSKGQTRTWQIIAFVDQPDGTAVLTTTLAFEARERMSPEDIAAHCELKQGAVQCPYANNWTRDAPKKK